MITAARPITIAPRPMLISAEPWYCAYNAPARPTNPFEITSPNTFVAFVLIPCALAMFGLHPVARTLAPISVPKNQ